MINIGGVSAIRAKGDAPQPQSYIAFGKRGQLPIRLPRFPPTRSWLTLRSALNRMKLSERQAAEQGRK